MPGSADPCDGTLALPATASPPPPVLAAPAKPPSVVSDPSLLPDKAAQVSDQDHLQQARREWRSMLRRPLQLGERRFLVSPEFLAPALDLDAATLPELVDLIGPLDNTEIEELVADEAEFPPHVPRELYDSWAQHFGLEGAPVTRLVVSLADGSLCVEEHPPLFVIHTLTETSSSVKTYQHHDRSAQGRLVLSLSLANTFRDLVEQIQSGLFKAKKLLIRVWFVGSPQAKELAASVSVATFVETLTERRLVGPKILDATLASQGITEPKYHVVVETCSRVSQRFPLDAVVASYNDEADLSKVLKTGGHLGLSNLGNTCYMNSALQCLVHLPEINYYFFFNLFKNELNRTNPLGNKGEVAVAFSGLLHKLFDANASTTTAVTPRDFKYVIGLYSSMFRGYQQQDSQEFLSWLLDALHEDLNRIHNKPYLEKPELKDEDVGDPTAIRDLANTCWHQHKQRNDSIIVDLFTGLYQSTLICPECSKQSITFDPFNDLTLPLPVNKKWYHEFTIVDLSASGCRPQIRKLEVELTKSSNYEDLLSYLSSFLAVPTKDLFLFEIFRNYFYRNFQEGGATNKFLPISELISDGDAVIVYIIPHDPLHDIIVPIVNTVHEDDSSYNYAEPFGIPLFIVLNEAERSSFGTIRQKMEHSVKALSSLDMEARYAQVKQTLSKKYRLSKEFPLLHNDTKEDEMIVDELSGADQSTDGYDSDISLACPQVSASFGFEMKVYEETQTRFPKRILPGYTSLNSQLKSSGVLNIPHGRPHFNKLTRLADKLPELKRNYYHYPEFVLEKETKPKETLQPESEGSSDLEKNGFVMVERDIKEDEATSSHIEALPPATDIAANTLEDEDIDSDTNWDNVNPLFASVDQLNGPSAPLSDLDRDSDTKSPRDDVDDEAEDKHPVLVTSSTLLVADWNRDIYEEFFNEPEHRAWEEPLQIANPELENSKKMYRMQQNSKISLYECLKNFSTPEVLGERDLWYCPRCKEHRRATKTIQLWSTGDILTIHLKRFQSARQFSDKISMVVDFPIEGLDMTEFVKSNEGDSLIYDLVAVDNHYGGLGGGHYTGSAKNFRDGRWYYFDDSRVTLIDDPQACVTEAAYLLFYKKRMSSPLAGGASVEKLLQSGRHDFESQMSKRKHDQEQIVQEIEEYKRQEDEILLEKEAEINATVNEMRAAIEEDEDLYEDEKEVVRPVSNKKSRSPLTEQSMKFEFENQRKQRLISKDLDEPKAVNINVGQSPAVSNLASPTDTSEEEE